SLRGRLSRRCVARNEHCTCNGGNAMQCNTFRVLVLATTFLVLTAGNPPALKSAEHRNQRQSEVARQGNSERAPSPQDLAAGATIRHPSHADPTPFAREPRPLSPVPFSIFDRPPASVPPPIPQPLLPSIGRHANSNQSFPEMPSLTDRLSRRSPATV